MADLIESLICITAHELTHIREHWQTLEASKRRGWNSERATMFEERRVLELFRANREALLAEWHIPPAAKPANTKPTRAEANEAKARKLLAAWERKLKLAKTKAAIYRRKVRRYDRIAATRAP